MEDLKEGLEKEIEHIKKNKSEMNILSKIKNMLGNK